MACVPDLLSYACVQTPDHPAVIAGDRVITFRKLDSRANRLVRLFLDFSLEAGDVIALLAKNEAEYFEIHVAAIRAGLVLMPLNFRLALPELEYIVADSKPELLICGEEFSEIAAALPVQKKCTLGAEYNAVIASMEPVDRCMCCGP